jgi:broad specificity phosphatase PhoE
METTAMREIVLVRHGETEWSLTGRHTGRTDLPLTPAGRRQAEVLGRQLGERGFVRVLTSPLRRAVDTCALAGLGERAEVSPELTERDYGRYEGRTIADIQSDRPGWSLWAHGAPGGETAADVGTRVDRLLSDVEAVDGPVVVFAHGHLLRVLTARWLSLPPEQGRLFALATAAVSVLGFERDTPVVVHWNQTYPAGTEGSKAGETMRVTTGPTTLAIDIGASGLKASVLDATGAMVVERVRVETTYPCPPDALVAALVRLVTPLPAFDRVAVGFPGMVRNGRTLSASNFATVSGPGSKVSRELSVAWERFDLAGALEAVFGRPTRVVNDADMQGAAVVAGKGLELVVTLGTGFGTAVFVDGRLFPPHLEVSHHPFRKGETYDEALGEEGRRRVGTKKWSQRVRQALQTLDALLILHTTTPSTSAAATQPGSTSISAPRPPSSTTPPASWAASRSGTAPGRCWIAATLPCGISPAAGDPSKPTGLRPGGVGIPSV